MQPGQKHCLLKVEAQKDEHLFPTAAAGFLKVYLFNVGQGDHILLELPNGEYGIIDFYYESTLGLKEPPALTYLDNVMRENPEKPIRLAFVCISHPDHDHVKGVDSFLDWVTENGVVISNFWLPPGEEVGDLCERYDKAFKKYAKNKAQKAWGTDYKIRLKGIKDYLARNAGKVRHDYLQGAIRTLHKNLGGMEVTLVAPLTRHIERFNKDLLDDFFKLMFERTRGDSAKNNLLSSVLMMVFNEHRLLFGGDAGLDVWLDSLDVFEQTGPLACGPCEGNFIKASHHGSSKSSSVELWTKIMRSDTKIGISAGKGKGHPHEKTLLEIRAAARETHSRVNVFSTNTCTECFIHQTIPPEDLDYLTYAPPGYAIETEQTLRRIVRPSARVGQEPTLGSYNFRFGGYDGTVSVTKGLVPARVDRAECVYHFTSGSPDRAD